MNTLGRHLISVEILDNPIKKSDACRSLINDLPNWFGIPDANASYVAGVASHDAFIVRDTSKEIIGMLSLRFPFPNNADIYWLGVRPTLHRQGVGRQLFEAAQSCAAAKGCTTMTVETLGPNTPDPGYDRTRKFYEAIGFSPMFELNPYGPDNTLLYMVCRFKT